MDVSSPVSRGVSGRARWFRAQSTWSEEETSQIWQYDMLFGWEAIKDRAPECFAQFLEIRRKAGIALDFYVGRFYDPKGYLSREFADLAQGLEGLHRLCRGGDYMARSDYKRDVLPYLLKAIPDGLNPEHHKQLVINLKNGYRYSLNARLTEITHRFADCIRDVISEPETEVTHIVKLRNDFAHANPCDHESETSWSQWHRLKEEVRFLFQLEFLDLLGFPLAWIKERASTLPSARTVKWATRSPNG